MAHTSSHGYRLTPRSWIAELREIETVSTQPIQRLLRQNPTLIDSAARDLGRFAVVLGPAFLDDDQRRHYARADFAGQDTWVRAHVRGLRVCPWIGEATDTTSEVLAAELERKGLYSTIQLGAAILKSQGMDTLLCVASLSTWTMQRVLKWLRDKLADPRVSEDEKSELLVDFLPALQLLREEEGLREDQQSAQSAEEDELLRQVEAAEAQAEELKAKFAARQGKMPDADFLKELESRFAEDKKEKKGAKGKPTERARKR
jgi:hypothetical protein